MADDMQAVFAEEAAERPVASVLGTPLSAVGRLGIPPAYAS
jgi:hypothetical protein